MGKAAKNHLSDKSFQDFYLSDETLRALEEVNYVDPTPVQAQSIPLVMAGIDLIVMSQTGTGKTAAFAIPTIEMLDPEPGRIDVLILAPTRELAIQVNKEFARLGQFKDVDVATIYGGTSYEKQYRALETANVVSATPGRLLDLLQNGKLDLSQLSTLILDEADEMLSMGFAEELDAILTFLPEERQSLLFSATITNEVKALSKKLLYYPEFISMSDDSVAAEDVTHAYYPVNGVGRARDLLRVLEYEQPEQAIIFANTKNDTFMVTRFLKRHGFRADVLNGDLPQKERERTLASLRDGKTDLLVATDVAARGIDISDLSHVFNYVIPESAEVYIHRTGRTGRAGKKGRAVSLISPAEFATLFNVKKNYKITPEKLSLPTTRQILDAKRKRHVEKLRTTLADTPGIPYGGKIGIAQYLLESDDTDDNSENVRLVARLLALADKVALGEDTADLTAALAREVEESSKRAEENDAETEESAEEPEAEAAAETQEEDRSEKKSSRRSSNRRSSGRRKESAEASDSDQDEQKASSDDSGDGRRRRRRRRRGNGSDESTSEKSASEKSASEKSESSSNGSSRRKSSGSRKSSRRSGSKKSSGRGKSSRRSSGSRKSSRRSSGKKSSSRSSNRRSEPKTDDKPMSKLWVNMGRDQFEKPDEVVEMVCYMAGMDPEDIGKVSLESSFSYVEVREDYFYDIIKAMNQQDWKGETVAAEPARK